MFTQFFGQFLLNNGLITSEQLRTVFNQVKSTRLMMGTIAINEGFLSAKQVEEINSLQKTHDKRFGEVAVQFKYLTGDQLDIVINKQQSEHMILAQAIMDLNYMTYEEFEESIEVFKRLHGISNESFNSLKDGKIEHVIYSMLDIPDEMIKEYVTLFYKNIIRFITPEVHISESVKLTGSECYHRIFEQEIYGAIGYYTAFTADDDTLVPFAEKYAGESMNGVDEFTIDVCKEFLNLHNGLFTVNMSNKGHALYLKIQDYKEDITVQELTLYEIPFHTNMGDFKLIIGN